MVELNLLGLLHCTHAALPHLVEAAGTGERRVADIVNVSSVAGRVARNGSGVYNATKHGVGAFSESLRQELLSEHVRVSVVEPGMVDAELVSHLSDTTGNAARRQVGRIEALLPEDIADAIGYIVTRERRVAANEGRVPATHQQR